jgi:antitoxin PrlF
MPKAYATMTSKGQFTLPKEVREAWELKPGDRIGFEVLGPREGRVETLRRRSILEGLDRMTIRPTDPLTQSEIDAAIDNDLDDKLRKAGWPARP